MMSWSEHLQTYDLHVWDHIKWYIRMPLAALSMSNVIYVGIHDSCHAKNLN